MEQFQILRVSFDDKTIIDTYDQSIIEILIEELKKQYKTDHIMSEKSHNGWTSVFTKKKNKIIISKQLVLYIIGANGWEPFSVDHESNSFYFRKKTIEKK